MTTAKVDKPRPAYKSKAYTNRIVGKSLKELTKATASNLRAPMTDAHKKSLREGGDTVKAMPNKERPPKTRTPLQAANTQVQWVSNFMLHTIPINSLNSVATSDKTHKLLAMHASLTVKIKQSLHEDYKRQREATQAKSQ